ncbi:MAG: DUF2202 domain-containing protein [Sphaerochaetaceae bacterium]|jgi:hypothetical protein|nr:DUF2202 domain-containing protein [Sphaerochaetaceae bacterium]MDX9810466.1 DUF2202 domain-containing protein [Sphaerochaetaceae bacterium]
MKKVAVYMAALLLVVVSTTTVVSAQAAQEIQLQAEIAQATEQDGILLMREEEKLARDVYLALYETWNLRTFSNIARAEQRHIDAVAALMKYKGIDDQLADALPGVFTIPKMAALYEELVARGSQSVTEALKVAAFIEDLDIYDLELLIAEAQDETTIRVYENLLAGSEQHMRAFVGQLSRFGETYESVYIDAERLSEILKTR